jgi:hypothetical protein
LGIFMAINCAWFISTFTKILSAWSHDVGLQELICLLVGLLKRTFIFNIDFSYWYLYFIKMFCNLVNRKKNLGNTIKFHLLSNVKHGLHCTYFHETHNQSPNNINWKLSILNFIKIGQ